MDKIEVRAARYPVKQVAPVHEMDGVPADLRNLEAFFLRETPAFSPKEAQSRNIRALFASFKEKLHTYTDAEEGDLPLYDFPDRIVQPVFLQVRHGIAKISDPRKYNMIRR